MARRPSTTRSSRTPAAPRIGADGKVEIFCPSCATRFRLDEAALDARVQCTVCENVFLPRNTLGKIAKGKDYTKAYMGFGALVVVLIGGIALLMNKKVPVETKPTPAAIAAPKPGEVLEKERARRRDQLIRWAQKVAAGDIFLIREYSDLDGLCAMLGINKKLPKEQLDAEILRALKANNNTRLLYEFDCNSGSVGDDAVKANAGQAKLVLTPRPLDENYDRLASGELQVDFKMDADTVKVSGVKVLSAPKRRAGR